jgi:hypothetical protein
VSNTAINSKTSATQRFTRIERALVFGVALFITALGYALLLVFQPQNLSDIGTGYSPQQPVKARDLTKVFSEAIEGSYALRITEEEINAYLEKTLHARQGGALGGVITLEKVWVRLESERAEIIMIRKGAGLTLTTSMWVAIEQTENDQGRVETHIDPDGGPYTLLPFIRRGGRFGQLVVPQGFLHLVQSSYARMASLYPEEIRLGFEEMARIRIEEGALVLDPRHDQGPGLMDF